MIVNCMCKRRPIPCIEFGQSFCQSCFMIFYVNLSSLILVILFRILDSVSLTPCIEVNKRVKAIPLFDSKY